MAAHPDITIPVPMPVAGNPDMLRGRALDDDLSLKRRGLGLHDNLLNRGAVLDDHSLGLRRGRHLDIEANVQPACPGSVGQQCHHGEVQNRQAS